MTTLKISGISQEKFEDRVKSAIESVTQSPIVKRKKSIIKKAMVHLLHGDNGVGQNEHNLSQFFVNSVPENEGSSVWVGTENYSLESDLDDMTSTYEANSLFEVELALFTSVIEYLSSQLEHSIQLDLLEKTLLVHGITPFSDYFEENNTEQSTMDGEEVSDLIVNTVRNNPLEVVRSIFEFISDLSLVKGSYHTKEVKLPLVVEELKEEKISVYITNVHNFELDNEFSDQADKLSNVETFLARSVEKQEDKIEKIFYDVLPEGSMTKRYMLEHDVFETLLEESDKSLTHFDSCEPSDILDWMLSQIDVMDLIDFIKDITHGTVDITTSVEYI